MSVMAQGEISRESRETSLLAQFGTKSQLEDALAGFAFRMRTAASVRDKALARAQANIQAGGPVYEDSMAEYRSSSRMLDTFAGFRNALGQALAQIVSQQMPAYQGLRASEFGHLAALGGFGSASALADPSLDLTREQVELLREILRKIPEETAALYN